MSVENRQVVIVSQMFPPEPGGNASRAGDFAGELAGLGWDVHVLAPPPSMPPETFDRDWTRARSTRHGDATVSRLWTWQPREEDPSFGHRLAYFLIFAIHALLWVLWNHRRIDVILTTTPPISTHIPGYGATFLGIPWIIDVRDRWIEASISLGYLTPGGTIERASRAWHARALRKADRVTVTTETLGNELVTSYGAELRNRILQLPNGADPDRFDPDPDDQRSDGGTTTEPADRATIIYTGNLGSAQALEPFIRAMTHLDPERVHLLLIGGGDRESHLRQVAKVCDVTDRVTFHPPVDRANIPSYLRSAKIGIAPLKPLESLRYAVPSKMYEYFACELPVIVTGAGEIERIIEASGGGVHVKSESREIARAISELLEDRTTRREMGRRGRAYILEEYDRRKLATRLSDELSAVMIDG